MSLPWQLSHGFCPSETKGKRVFVKLRNGTVPNESWAADGRNGCQWAMSNHPFDIVAYVVA